MSTSSARSRFQLPHTTKIRSRLAISLGAAAALVVAPMVGVLPTSSASATDVSDWNALVATVNGVASGGEGFVKLTSNINDSATGALSIAPGASVILYLDGYVLTIDDAANEAAGISVPFGATLTIQDVTGAGVLTVTGGVDGAGIGGSSGVTAGNIAIEGGNVYATGGAAAAGIGGGLFGDGGTVTISGGMVQATGGTSGAGIGGGSLGEGGTTNVSGGNVQAVGGTDGSGIGSGSGSSADSTLNVSGTASAGSYPDGGQAFGSTASGVTPVFEAGRVFTVASYGGTYGGASIAFSSVVTFNSAGGSAVADQVVPDGSTATQPADPTNGGLALYGWYDAANNPYDFSTPVDRPITLHAGWPALAVSISPTTTLNAGDTVPLTAHIYNTGNLAFVADVTAASGITSDFANDDTTDPTAVTVEFDPATGKVLTLHTFTVHCIIPGLDLTASAGITVAPVSASAVSELTASSTTPNQGDAISMTFKVNGVDVTSYATFTSDVATDVIAGNGVTFPHASPHTITATYGAVSAQLVIQVTPTAVVDPTDSGPGTTDTGGGELAGTGFTDSATALWAGALLMIGTLILTGRKVIRRRA